MEGVIPESGRFSCRIAGLDCVVESHGLLSTQLGRFGPFIIPDWMVTDRSPVRSAVSERIMRRLSHRHPRWGLPRLALESICHMMLDGFARRKVIAVSGVCIEYENCAYLFSSSSGSAASNVPFDPFNAAKRYALLWRRYLGDGVRLVGSGWIALSEVHDGRDVYIAASGTPWWIGSDWRSEAVTYPLGGWCFAGSADAAHPGGGVPVERADASTMVTQAMRCIYIPDDSRDAAIALGVLDRVLLLTSLYRMHTMAEDSDGFDESDGHGGSVDESHLAASFELLTGRSYEDARVEFPWPILSAERTWASHDAGSAGVVGPQ